MDGIKELRRIDFELIVAEKGFEEQSLVKDYYITILLHLMRNIKGLYFKGGTAINKMILDHSRISEDIDFTTDRPIADVRKEIKQAINASKMFGTISQDKDVDGFVRLIVPYNAEFGKGEIFIDVNERGKLILKPALLNVMHFYPNIPKFSVMCLAQEEMIAEKVAAAIGRNKPRDHYDIYRIIEKNIPINMELVKKKCLQSGHDPSILKMFNNAKKLKTRWDSDMLPLLADNISFQEVMQTLAKHFKLKEEKDKKKVNQK